MKNSPLENSLTLQVFSLLVAFFLNIHGLSAQVGIGTSDPDPSSILHIESANRGVLLPKVNLQDLKDKNTVYNPTEGLLVYNKRDDGAHYPAFTELFLRYQP